MTKQELAAKIYRTAHLTGRFTLRSGQISNEYFDKYLFESDPVLLAEIARQMKPIVPQDADGLAGLEMGGIPVSTALSLELGMPSVFVRKKAKEYGTCKLAEGLDVSGKRLCVVEDVVTTGGQIIESVEELRKLGAEIDTVICVILRNEAAYEKLGAAGLKLSPLMTMDYMKSCV